MKTTVNDITGFLNKFRHCDVEEDVKSINISKKDLSSFFSDFSIIHNDALKKGNMFNLFEVLSPKEDEVKNCKILRWLLDCRGSHGLGNCFAKALIANLSISNIEADSLNNSYQCFSEVYPLGDMGNRVDIIFGNNEFIVYLEAKINAQEGEYQISRYIGNINLQGCQNRAVIFLTRNGEAPESARDNGDIVYSISWKFIANIFLKELIGDMTFPKLFIKMFCNHISNF